MSDQIRIDLSTVTVMDFVEFQIGISHGNDADKFSALIEFGDKAIVGGIKDMPMTNLPVILSKLTKCLSEESDTIALAIASMQTYLKDKEDE